MISDGVIRLRKFKYVLVVLIAILLAFMFHVNTYDNMDFVRHSQIMDYIRDSHISLKFFLSNADNINQNETSSDNIVFNILEYYFATTFKNNYVFVWFLTAVDYSIIAYIAYEYRGKKGYKLEEVLFAISFCFGYLPFVHVVSGLRTANAMCLVALGIYLLFFKDLYLIPFLLFFTAVMIHSIIIIPVLVAIFVRAFPYRKVLFVFGGTFFLINVVMSCISLLNVSFLTNLALKYSRYTGARQFKGYKFSFYGALVFCVIYLLYYICFYFFKKKRKKTNSHFDLLGVNTNGDDKKDKIFLFFASYSIVIICNYNGYELVHRLSYLFGAFTPIITDFFYEPKKGIEEQTLALLTQMSLWLLVLAMCALNIFHYYRFFL